MAITVTYRHKNRVQAAQWVMAAAKAESEADSEKLLELLVEVIDSWTGLIDGQGDPVPFSPTSLAALTVNFIPSRGELYQAYVTELTVAKRKN